MFHASEKLKENARALAAALIPILFALECIEGLNLRIYPELYMPFNIYLVSALAFRTWAQIKNIRSYKSYFMFGIFTVSFYWAVQEILRPSHSVSDMTLNLGIAVLYGALLASFFWSWTISSKIWTKALTTFLFICITGAVFICVAAVSNY